MSRLQTIACVLSCTMPVLFSLPANAFEFNGSWTTDASKCSEVFVKKKNKITITPKSDLFGGGFMVDGDHIRGPFLTCKIINRKNEAAALHLVISCSSMIALLSPMQLDVRIDSNDKITRVFSNFTDMEAHYERCHGGQE